MITLETIAKKCGVSKMTVSRALSDKNEMVSEKVRQKILKVAKEYHYRQNRLANSLNTGRTYLIGYLASEFRHFQSSVFSGVLSTLVPRGYDILTLQWSKALKTGDALLKSIVDRRVEGVLLFHEGPGCDYSYLQELQTHRIPIVVLDRDVNVSGLGYVGLDNFNGSVEATSHLLQLGHRSVIFLCREEDWGYSTTTERFNGYRETMEKAGLQAAEPVIVPTEIFNTHDCDELENYIRRHTPTAVLADNDVVAAGCILALTEKGYRIPEQLSVVGFGNIKGYVNLIRPRLTTMDLNPKQIGVEASGLLLDMIAEKYSKEKIIKNNRIVLPMKLVVRESTSPVVSGVS